MHRQLHGIASHCFVLGVLVAGAGCAAHSAPAEAGPSAPGPASPSAAPAPEPPRVSGTGDPPPPAPPEPEKPKDPEIPAAAPPVKVKNIGLHVGGGPNDAATKAPFEAAIAKHFEDFRACYAKVEKPGARGTFGIDLLVDAKGGHPTPSNSRTALPGAAFRDCVAHVFELVEFDPPKRGATKISYALSFEPE